MTNEEYIRQLLEEPDEHKYMLESDHKGKIIHEIEFDNEGISIYFTDMTYLQIWINKDGNIYEGNIEGQYIDNIDEL